MEHNAVAKKKRKDEGKRLKKQKILEAGGKRPRPETATLAPKLSKDGSQATRNPIKVFTATTKSTSRPKHSFGRVMEQIPCRNRPRYSTVSIAVPGSIVANCQTREQKTQIAGQIARAATIYHVDEIVVYDDQLAPQRTRTSDAPNAISEPNAFLARILQYCECPQYLRRHFFPVHPDLQFVGMLAPIDAPHHVRADDKCKFREGLVMEKRPPKKQGGGSLVNCGIRQRPVL